MPPKNTPTVYYVYGLIDPFTNEIFYVGKGKGYRWKDHLRGRDKQNKRKRERIKFIQEQNENVNVVFFQTEMTETDAYALEENLISFYGRQGLDENGTLTNVCPSNRPPDRIGWSMPAETKKKIGLANKGNSRFGSDNGFYGRRHSDATRAVLSEKCGRPGTKKSEETKARMRQSFTDKRREHLSEARIQWNQSDKMRDAVAMKNKIAGHDKITAKVKNNLALYKKVVEQLEVGIPVAMVSKNNSCKYKVVWDVNRRLDYFADIIKDLDVKK